jgi:hypothetical protein
LLLGFACVRGRAPQFILSNGVQHNANRNRGTAFFHAVAAEADAQSPHDSYSRDLIREHAKNFNLSKAERACRRRLATALANPALAQSLISPATCGPAACRRGIYAKPRPHRLGGGADTSSSTLICFVLACIAFPEVLPRA